MSKNNMLGRKEISNLARDNAEARKAGLTYGKYKALQYEGQQKEINELIQKRKERRKARQ